MRLSVTHYAFLGLGLLLAWPQVVAAQLSPLDPNFGVDGQVVTNVGQTYLQQGNDVARLPDGRFLVAGAAYSGSMSVVLLARCLPDGALDPTFGEDGIVWYDFGFGSDATATGLAIATDGSIIVSVYAGGPQLEQQGALLKFRHDGTLDPSFGSDGVVFTSGSAPSDLALQNESLLITYATDTPGIRDIILARYTLTGVLDLSFGVSGFSRIQVGTDSAETPETLEVMPDGRILVAGHFEQDVLVARLTPQGALDASFGVGGIAITSLSSGNDRPRDIALLQDGRIIVAGAAHYSASSSDNGDFAFARYLPNGSLDTSLNGTGIVTLDLFQQREQLNTAVTLQDGSMVFGGFSWTGTVNSDIQHVLLKYNEAGVLDLSFGNQGIIVGTTERIGYVNDAFAVMPDPPLAEGGAIVVVGVFEDALGVARYTLDGDLDPAFEGGGMHLIGGVAPGIDYAQALLIDERGITVGGSSESWSSCYLCPTLVRYSHDGDIDTSYGQEGVVQIDGYYDLADVLALPDGKLMVFLSPYYTVTLVRLLPDGSRDPSFGTDGLLEILPPGSGTFRARAFLRQPDGKLLLVGTESFPNGIAHVSAIRLSAEGSLDPAFGTNGMTTIEGDDSSVGFSDAVLLSDGRILLAVQSDTAPTGQVLLALRQDGTLDTDFGTDGYQPLALQQVTAMQVQDGDRIVVAGSPGVTFGFIRVYSDGTLDTSFGADGRVLVSIGGNSVALQSLALQPDGKVVAGGFSYRPDDSRLVLVRLTPDGNRDESWGTDGVVRYPFEPFSVLSTRVGITPQSRVIASHSVEQGYHSDYSLLGFLPVTPTSTAPSLPGPIPRLALAPIIPNPSGLSATSTLRIDRAQHVKLTITDVLGREVAIVFEGAVLAQDSFPISLPTSRLSSGVYYLRAVGEAYQSTQRFTVVR